MRAESLFTNDKNIYWPSEFIDVMNLLTGKNGEGKDTGMGLFPFNTGALVFAATIGFINNRQRDVGPNRKEILLSTFSGHYFHARTHSLERYISFIGLLSSPEIDETGQKSLECIRPEREEELIERFQKYAAGGLEYIAGVIERTGSLSAEVIVRELLPKKDGGSSANDIPPLF